MQDISNRVFDNTKGEDHRNAEEHGLGHLTDIDSDYERTLEKVYEARMVMEGMEDVIAKRTIDGNTALTSIKNKYGI